MKMDVFRGVVPCNLVACSNFPGKYQLPIPLLLS